MEPKTIEIGDDTFLTILGEAGTAVFHDETWDNQFAIW